MDQSIISHIGLTGGIGTGKSTVSRYLIDIGYPVVDSDKLAHSVLEPDGECVQAIVRMFGRGVLDESGGINRKKLGQIVFDDRSVLLKLNEIMHPVIRNKSDQLVNELVNNGSKLIFSDIPLLFENKLSNNFKAVLLVYCPQEMQIERVSKRDKIPEVEVLKRINNQMNIEEKRKLADFVIENTSTLEALYCKVDVVLNQIKKGADLES